MKPYYIKLRFVNPSEQHFTDTIQISTLEFDNYETCEKEYNRIVSISEWLLKSDPCYIPYDYIKFKYVNQYGSHVTIKEWKGKKYGKK